jgi:hypothetical protein
VTDVREKIHALGFSTSRGSSLKPCPRCGRLVGHWISFGKINTARHKDKNGRWCRTAATP